MNADLTTGWCGVDGIEQEVGNDLDDFTTKAYGESLCLNALIDNDS